MKAWKAELFLVLITLIWGGTFTFTKIGIEYVSPLLYLTIRLSIAMLLTYIVYFKHLRKFNRETFIHGTLLGLMFGGGFALQTYGLAYTTVSISGFITGITVVLTPFVFWFVEKKKVLPWSKVGVIIVTIGLYMLTKPDFDNLNIGDVVTLISTFFWAFYITYMDVFTRGREGFTHTIQLVFLQFVAAILVSTLGFLFIERSSFYISFDMELVYSLVFNSILASFVVTFVHTRYQRYTTPVKAALIFSLEPVVATGVALLVFGEVLTVIGYIGAVIIMLGVLSSELGDVVVKKYFRRD